MITRMFFLTVLSMILSGCTSRPGTDPLIVAHRGASWDAPENTLPAFLLAWEQGADAIEGDFFLTADGEIVCIHDRHTGRVSDSHMVVSESSLADLRKLDVGSWKGEEWENTRIPTLAEVFEIVPEGKKIFVEIKPGPEILPRLYEEIDHAGLDADQIIIISFNSDVIRHIKSDRPEHKAYWLSGFREDDQGNPVPGLGSILQVLEETGADGFSSHHGMVTKEIIDGVKNEGYEYHVWTVNDGNTAVEFLQYGARSITTDRPGYIREYLETF